MTSTYITSNHLFSCHGEGIENLWNAALRNESSIHDGIGRIPNFTGSGRELQNLMEAAIESAMKDAKWMSLNDTDGLILATTTGFVCQWEDKLIEYEKGNIPLDEFLKYFSKESLGTLIDVLRNRFSFKGRALLLSSACSASTQALGVAKMWIETGAVKRCLVGGVETLSRLTYNGFESFNLISKSVSKPFDLNRTGINLSEAVVFHCLESKKTMQVEPVCEILGYGTHCDAYHMTAPHPEGDGMTQSINAALKQAKCATESIDWVHAHGTGSIHNDQSEAKSIKNTLGENTPVVSSTKGIHGHALAASGTLETAIIAKCFKNKLILPTSGLDAPDPTLPIKTLTEAESPRTIKLNRVLKTTLGFGGTNAALVFGAPQ